MWGVPNQPMSSLIFERLNPDGNSPDAVVYLEDRSLLLYKGMHYSLDYTIPAGATVEVRLSLHNGYLFLTIDTVSRVVYKECAPRFFPNEEQQEKLTVLFQNHGKAVKEGAQKVLESVQDLKKLVHAHREELKEVFPDLDPDYIEIDTDCCDFCTGGCEIIKIEKLERNANEMIMNAHHLAKAEPFASKKRKVGDE